MEKEQKTFKHSLRKNQETSLRKVDSDFLGLEIKTLRCYLNYAIRMQ